MGVFFLLAQHERAPWWQWALFSVVVTLLELLLVGGALVALVRLGVDVLEYVVVRRPTYITDGRVAAGFALLLAAQMLGPLAAIPFFRPARRLVGEGLRLPRAPARAVLGRLVMGIGLIAGVQWAWSVVGAEPSEPLRMVDHLVYATWRGGTIGWMLLAVCIAAPVAEEVLFRGLTFGLLRRRWGFWAGAVTSAVLFGLPHGLANALPTTVLGFYLAYQAEKDGSLLGPMMLHMLNNLAAMAIMIYPMIFR